jgi:type IV secretory pathway TraG/TraD family ATPase VirD4
LLEARRPSLRQIDDHWNERATTLLAPLLHAAFVRATPLRELLRSVDDRDSGPSSASLIDHYGANHPAVTSLRAIEATEERERSSIWSTTAGLFAGLRSDAALAAAERAPLDLDTFFLRPTHLHVVAPSRHHTVATPLVVGLIDDIVSGCFTRPHARLLLALDELANVAPLPRLPSIVSEGGGLGVTVLACLQDLSQARSRWGALGESFLSLFPTTCVLPGVADRATLELVSRLAGEVPTPQATTSKGRRSVSWSLQPRLSLADVAHGRPGYALVLGPTKHLSWAQLTPYYSWS